MLRYVFYIGNLNGIGLSLNKIVNVSASFYLLLLTRFVWNIIIMAGSEIF